MLLSQVLTRVAQGPLRDTPFGGDASGVVPEAHVPLVVGAVQTALTALYTRFPMALKTLTIAVVDGLFEYPLRAEFAQSSASTELNKFIQDDPARPYTGDLLAIEHLLDSEKCELPINNRQDCTSWFTTAPDVLAMDYPVTGEIYFVQYRANHATLDTTLDPLELGSQVVAMPESMVAALLAKIAYEVFCAQTGETATLKAQEQLSKYEMACQTLEMDNTASSSVIDARVDKVRNGGWI